MAFQRSWQPQTSIVVLVKEFQWFMTTCYIRQLVAAHCLPKTVGWSAIGGRVHLQYSKRSGLQSGFNAANDKWIRVRGAEISYKTCSDWMAWFGSAISVFHASYEKYDIPTSVIDIPSTLFKDYFFFSDSIPFYLQYLYMYFHFLKFHCSDCCKRLNNASLVFKVKNTQCKHLPIICKRPVGLSVPKITTRGDHLDIFNSNVKQTQT